MRVTSLASGSSGNALLVEAGPQGRTKLLLDAGLAGRVLLARLRQVGVHPRQLQAVLLSHEHSDHMMGLPALWKYGVQVMTAPETIVAIERSFAARAMPELGEMDWAADTSRRAKDGPALEQDQREVWPAMVAETSLAYGRPQEDEHKSVWIKSLSTCYPANVIPTQHYPRSYKPLQVDSRTSIGDIEVVAFPVSHDAVAPYGYLLIAGGCRVCVVVDSGEVTPAMLEMMQHADLLILEANHDRERLLRGPYPHALKQRILSPTGHLSNNQTAEAVLGTWRTDGVRWLWLSHLSRTNNTPKLALRSIQAQLEAAKANLAQIHISVLPPDMGHAWDSTQLWHVPALWEMPL